MTKVTAEEYLEKLNGINKFYAYHQIQIDSNHIEFGWVDMSDPDVVSVLHADSGRIVVARDPEDSDWDNAALLEDYENFFLRLTSLSPDEFIERWSPSMKELEAFWKSAHTGAPVDQHEFVMKIALLVRDGESFQMWGKEYEVFELESVEESIGEPGEEYEEGGDET